MRGIQSFKEFIAKNRHKMTPDQALKADQVVLDANVHVPSREATADEIVGQRYLGDPDWYAKNDGKDPTTRPLYPTSESQMPSGKPIEANQPPTMTSSEAKG